MKEYLIESTSRSRLSVSESWVPKSEERLEQFDHLLEELREVWRPRLEALAKKFGERVNVQPRVERGRRSANFQFKSELASVELRFAVAPDPFERCVYLGLANIANINEVRFA